MLNKKIISIILILTMIFSISANSLTAFAENAENQEKAEISDGTESVPDESNDKEENTKLVTYHCRYDRIVYRVYGQRFLVRDVVKQCS